MNPEEKPDLQDQPVETAKTAQLAAHTSSAEGTFLTTNQGLKINDNQNSLKAGERGPSLLEDFIFREKMTHFDHERIPERIVHARGSAAHGVFKVYEPLPKITRAGFLQDPSKETPVFVRFSTVAGSRGSTDVARDARGFSVKFYTEEGNYDLVGNNIPVFFIQDAIKFPDLIHAVKPEQDNEIPQAASAHDTFWDFIWLAPESMHMIMWVMSDRAIPRSYRMMEGFGVHTFRMINEAGESNFVKFHWKPLLGVHSIAWDEALKISGKDPDFHRRDLWDAIESGAFPEWELGIQVVPEADEHRFEFDLLDPTKLIPEELVPVQRIGKMTLNRNPDNFFAETEQVAFHPAHLVPGIDFTNDPLLQGRLFSYTDTQLSRLGSPNFHEIPINRPLEDPHNNQRGGHMRQTINKGKTSYEPNRIAGGCPFQAKWAEGGFRSFAEKIDAHKIRSRSESFFDHFSQATLFYNSQSEAEKTHIQDALCFELGKVNDDQIRSRVLRLLSHIDKDLAARVAIYLGLEIPADGTDLLNGLIPADADPASYQPFMMKSSLEASAPLSMVNTIKTSIKTRKVAILAADGVDSASLATVKAKILDGGGVVEIVAPRQKKLISETDELIVVDKSFLNTASVLYDAIFIPSGINSVATLEANPDAIHFINEAYRHCKAIAAHGNALQVLEATAFAKKLEVTDGTYPSLPGVIVSDNLDELGTAFIAAIAMHRFWDEEANRKVPA